MLFLSTLNLSYLKRKTSCLLFLAWRLVLLHPLQSGFELIAVEWRTPVTFLCRDQRQSPCQQPLAPWITPLSGNAFLIWFLGPHTLLVLLLSLWFLLSLLLVLSFLLSFLLLQRPRAQSGLSSVPRLVQLPSSVSFICPETLNFIAPAQTSPLNSGFVYPTVFSFSTCMSNKYPKLYSALPLHPSSTTKPTSSTAFSPSQMTAMPLFQFLGAKTLSSLTLLFLPHPIPSPPGNSFYFQIMYRIWPLFLTFILTPSHYNVPPLVSL